MRRKRSPGTKLGVVLREIAPDLDPRSLAKRLRTAPSTVSRLLNGVSSPRESVVRSLCRIYPDHRDAIKAAWLADQRDLAQARVEELDRHLQRVAPTAA